MAILLLILLLFNILFALVLVFFEKKNPTVTWAWLMILIFLPYIGFILYLFLGQSFRKKDTFAQKIEEEASIDILVAKQKELFEKVEHPINQDGMKHHLDIVLFNLLSSQSVYSEDNAVEFYSDGNKKFAKLFNDIENAKSFIHLEYYIIRDDELGRDLINLLTKKAKEGIEVKFLVDGMGGLHLPKSFFYTLIDAGGQVSIFYPPFVNHINIRINYRNHRKIAIIDGKCGYIGGLNVADEYISKSKKFGHWLDAHIRIEGSAISQLQLRFFMDWRFATKEDFDLDLKYFPAYPKIENGIGVQIIASGPDTKLSNIKNMYFKMINEAEHNIYIETPYFVPDESILSALKVAALSGIDIRIIIPSIPDHPFVYWANRSYAGDLLDLGVRFYYYNKGFVHSKIVSIDGILASVGTANMDIRSFETNFEVNSILYNAQFVSQIDASFLKDLEDCTEFTSEMYANRGIISNIKESFSRLLSPLL